MPERPALLGKGSRWVVVLAALTLAGVRGGQVAAAAPLPFTAAPGPAAGDDGGAVRTAAAGASAADPVARWRRYIDEASRRFGIPAPWIERVMRAESGGRTTLGGRPIVSRAGAMGLMQLMPGTWAAMRAQHSLGRDPFEPRDNILAGTAYLAAMHARFGYPGLFGAYNAGPARYTEWLAGRRALPRETRAYLAKVAGEDTGAAPSGAAADPPAGRTPVQPPPPRSLLFVVDRARSGAAGDAARPAAGGLFVALSQGASSPSEE